MKRFACLIAGALAAILPLGAQILTEKNSPVVREASLQSDIVVCGGGLAGVCAAVSAARHGASVVLIQDRPVLGGNASSEMRMGIVGVKEDQYQEGGILEEMQCRNFRYNPLLRYTLWDDIILSTVIDEPRIKLLLNTAVESVGMDGEKIASVTCWNSNAYTRYTVSGKIFCDCTGDGILRLSGAEFRRGTESASEFGESYLGDTEENTHTMGNSILLQLRKTDGEDHPFTAPDWAYHFTDDDFNFDRPKSTIPGVKFNYKNPYPKDNNYWWIEFGGMYDTIFDAPDIQLEFKKIAYGVWEYMKNNPDGRCKGYELDWIGSLPGKRESTRYVGPHILTQDDITSGGHFEDVVAYGGWTLDNHNPEGFFARGLASTEHKIGQGFGIPFDCLYSVNVPNLMFAGRDISATHMGLSATRVMATCALLGQAVGTAASVAVREGVLPADIRKDCISEVQAMLEDDDCLLPYRWRKPSALTMAAKAAPEFEALRNGIDREWDGEDNGVHVPVGSYAEYSWKKPVKISEVRLVFDSDFKVKSKRMRKFEATTERVQMPSEMARDFEIQVRVKKEWKTVATVSDNWKRLVRVGFDSVSADAIRVIPTSTWGAETAHIFAFDVYE